VTTATLIPAERSRERDFSMSGNSSIVPGSELFDGRRVGKLEVDGGDADLVVLDGGEVGPLLLVTTGGIVVNVVTDPPFVVSHLDELVLVEPPPQPGDPRPPELLARQIRRVDVEDSPRREALIGHLHQARGEIRRRLEVEPVVERHVLLGGLVPGAVDA
jgi:hypothetical protein